MIINEHDCTFQPASPPASPTKTEVPKVEEEEAKKEDASPPAAAAAPPKSTSPKKKKGKQETAPVTLPSKPVEPELEDTVIVNKTPSSPVLVAQQEDVEAKLAEAALENQEQANQAAEGSTSKTLSPPAGSDSAKPARSPKKKKKQRLPEKVNRCNGPLEILANNNN